MQIVLLERVEKLGQMGEVVSVKEGYARNFLLPQRKALRATEENLKHFEAQRAQLEARNLELRNEAEKVGDKLDGQSFVVIRQSGETGILYGSVNSRDIANVVSENGFSVDRTQVALDRQIKNLGLHDVRIVLHPEVSAVVSINVARSQDEAEQQAAGINVLAAEEDEELLELEEFFEDEEAMQAAEAELGTDDADGAESGDMETEAETPA
ncbi:MAG TPA: 50S ribosomal protein L9 [Alphaproteobacteria bacterium]|nr:50S ribosomal protein L9 [Alphaproteobacteria bacterium]HBF98828.1 50S ribosomal protein L9 [Alphaproteobacteria bacterium]HCO90342.1 50S ribosomal protein L9 [Alphaproteobacteria bacterium]